MARFSTLYGKALIATAVLIAFGVCLYAFKVQVGIVALFIISPVLIILLGKVAEIIILALENISTGPLSLTHPKDAILLICYYASFSTFMAFLVENSIILSLINLTLNAAHVAIVSLSLAFLPRILSYATGMERARSTLLAMLTPLTLTAAGAILVQPSTIALRASTVQLCFAGSLIQPIIGDLTLYFLSFLGLIQPRITFETISLLNLKRIIRSQAETIEWNNICEILKEGKRSGRGDIVEKILASMAFFIEESRRRGILLARIHFVDAVTRAIYSEPGLKDELTTFFRTLNKDKEVPIKTRVATYYGIISKKMPDESLLWLCELLNENDMLILNELGKSLTIMVQNNSKAVPHAVELSLKPVFLDWLMKQARYATVIQQIHVGTPEHVSEAVLLPEEKEKYETYLRASMRDGAEVVKHPILQALRAAYTVSPDIVVDHIQGCCSSKKLRLKILAAAIVSDEEFARSDKKFTRIRKKLEKDKDDYVRNALNFADARTTYRPHYR